MQKLKLLVFFLCA